MKKHELEYDAKSAERDKGRDQRKWGLGERLGSKDDSGSNHPVSKEHGTKAESNVGEDLTSGDG